MTAALVTIALPMPVTIDLPMPVTIDLPMWRQE
jgi:hypothetical protein